MKLFEEKVTNVTFSTDQTCSLVNTQSGGRAECNLGQQKSSKKKLYARVNTKSRTNVIRMTDTATKVN